MRWSKLKSRIKDLFATSVADRVDLHSTWYRTTGQFAGRAWMTVDGVEVENFSDVEWWLRYYPLAQELREINAATRMSDPGYYEAYNQAEDLLHRQAVYSRNDFYTALYDYLDLSVEGALSSRDPIIRALAMLDRRLGKRRLKALEISQDEHPLVYALFEFRREAEGLRSA